MLQDKIKDILKQGEGRHVEFKTSKFELNRDVFESVCAFLNREGGILLLGVKNTGEIEGVLADNPNKLNPPCYLTAQVVDYEGKKIIYVQVPESSQVHSTQGKIFDRNEDGDFEISRYPDRVTQLYLRKQAVYTENKVYRPRLAGVIDPANFTPYPKNPVIARFFKEIGWVDELGSGVRNIYRYCGIYTPHTQPVFIEGDVFKTIIPLKAERAITESEGLNVVDKVTDKVTDNQQKILELIEQNTSITTMDLAGEVSISQRKIKQNIQKLKEKGLIERIGPAKGGYWKVTMSDKYRVTSNI